MKSRSAAVAWVSLLVVLCLGCPSQPVPASDKPYPTTVEQAQELRGRGVSWSNEEVRAQYHRLIETIPAENERGLKEGRSAEERARRAFDIRHNARITTRAMMSSEREVEDLRKRDQEKYGNPDGPTFEYLVEKERAKGLSGDAVYESIIESAQRTDKSVDKKYLREPSR